MRAPSQVIVIPYRKINETHEFCVFYRNRDEYYQFIAGGGKDDETPLKAAIREANEEVNLPSNLDYKQLISTFYVPPKCISDKHRQNWSFDTIVLPEYCFYVEVKDSDFKISKEHTNYKWVDYDTANKLLYWQTNKVALYELNERIKLCIE